MAQWNLCKLAQDQIYYIRVEATRDGKVLEEITLAW